MPTPNGEEGDVWTNSRERVGYVVSWSFSLALVCNLVASFGVDGALFFAVRAVLGATFIASAAAWVVLWLLGRRARAKAT